MASTVVQEFVTELAYKTVDKGELKKFLGAFKDLQKHAQNFQSTIRKSAAAQTILKIELWQTERNIRQASIAKSQFLDEQQQAICHVSVLIEGYAHLLTLIDCIANCAIISMIDSLEIVACAVRKIVLEFKELVPVIKVSFEPIALAILVVQEFYLILEDILDNLKEMNINLSLLIDVLSGMQISVGEDKSFLDWLESITTIISNILSIITEIGPAFKTILPVLRSVCGALKSTALFLAANPIVLIIAAIVAAIVFAVYMIYIHWDKVKKFFIDSWEYLKGQWDKFTNVLSEIWDGITVAIVEAWDAVKVFFIASWEYLKSGWQEFTNVLSEIWDGITVAIVEAWDAVKVFFIASWEYLKSGWQEFTNFLSEIWDGITVAIVEAWNGLKAPFIALLEILKNGWKAFTNFLSEIWDNITGGIVKTWSAVIDKIQAAINKVKSFLGLKSNEEAKKYETQTDAIIDTDEYRKASESERRRMVTKGNSANSNNIGENASIRSWGEKSINPSTPFTQNYSGKTNQTITNTTTVNVTSASNNPQSIGKAAGEGVSRAMDGYKFKFSGMPAVEMAQ